ncbi:MAG: nucleotide exchange factor GrpE [Ignavibacteria bacterium]|nr:nucleotide exchange factor GrpE [Ignavibacteria bacterium]
MKDDKKHKLTKTEITTKTETNKATDEEVALDQSEEKAAGHDSELKELQEKVDELKDQFLRKAAEFENYKKRTETEKFELIKYANERLITEFLTVIDDFQRALMSYNTDKDDNAFHKGVEMIYHKLINILRKQGLKEINSTGEKFNVELHEALMQKPSDDVEPGTILETVEKGYFFKDKVLRHAKVIVSSKPEM